jgi:mannose-6-phosphate isomerase-like protein (cupin superfamily)
MLETLNSKVVDVRRSLTDDDALCRSSATANNAAGPEPDYSNTIVRKPWGSEYLLFQNQWTAGWILNLSAGYSTSMHCHPRKDTSLIVLSGRVRCKTFSGVFDREAGDAVFLEKGVFHQTNALSSEDVTLLEVETPPMKRDLVRLHDHYGRVGVGYEGAEHFTSSAKTLDFASYCGRVMSTLEFQSHALKIGKVRGTELHDFVNKTKLSDLVVLLNDAPTYGEHPLYCGKVIETQQLWTMNTSSSAWYYIGVVTKNLVKACRD